MSGFAVLFLCDMALSQVQDIGKGASPATIQHRFVILPDADSKIILERLKEFLSHDTKYEFSAIDFDEKNKSLSFDAVLTFPWQADDYELAKVSFKVSIRVTERDAPDEKELEIVYSKLRIRSYHNGILEIDNMWENTPIYDTWGRRITPEREKRLTDKLHFSIMDFTEKLRAIAGGKC